MKASQSFSVHDGDESESKDQVLKLETQKPMPGNSTVNMASVVPIVKIV